MKAQIALEFVIIFALVVIVFLFFFGLIISQRAIVLNQQGFSQLQLVAQDIAQQIDLAAAAGSGYYSNSSLYSNIGLPIHGVNISRAGVVIATAQLGTQNSVAVSYSKSRDVLTSGVLNTSYLEVQNYLGEICVDYQCYNMSNSSAAVHMSAVPSRQNGLQGYKINAYVTGSKGNAVGNVLLGFQTSSGNFTGGSEKQWFTNYTDSNGIASAFLYQGGSAGPAAVTATAFYQANGMANNLTGWWPMNLGSGPEVYDISGYGNTGTTANATYAFPAFASMFNGNSYMTTNAISNSPNTITINLWVRPAAYSNDAAIIGQGNVGTDSWEIFQTQKSYEFDVYGVGSADFGNVNANAWSMITASYNALSENLTAYVNGLPVGTFSFSTELYSNAPILFGYSEGDSQATYYKGMMANIQLYNESLSSNAIYTLYSDGLQTPPVFSSKLLGWWPLEGNGADYGTYGNNAVISGGVLFEGTGLNSSYNVNASSGYAAVFNGVNSVITVNNPSNALRVSVPTNGLSVSAWIMLNASQNSRTFMPMAGTKGAGFLLSLFVGNYIRIGNANGDIYDVQYPLRQGVWYNIIGTASPDISSATISSIYVNGKLVGTGDSTGQWQSSTSWTNLDIGYFPATGTYFNGIISNVQVYNRTLTQSNASLLYLEGQQGTPLRNGIVGWWPLEGSNNDSSKYAAESTSSNIVYSQYQFQKQGMLQYSDNSYGVDMAGAGNVVAPNNVIIGSNTLSVLAWIYPSEYIKNTEGVVNLNGVNGGLYIDAKPGTQGAADALFGVDVSGTWTYVNCNNVFPNPDAWYSIAGIYNGTYLSFYVNGAVVGSTKTTGGAVTLPDNSVVIGGLYGHQFNGTIANVQVYKSALSANQILLLSKIGMPPEATIDLGLSGGV